MSETAYLEFTTALDYGSWENPANAITLATDAATAGPPAGSWSAPLALGGVNWPDLTGKTITDIGVEITWARETEACAIDAQLFIGGSGVGSPTEIPRPPANGTREAKEALLGVTPSVASLAESELRIRATGDELGLVDVSYVRIKAVYTIAPTASTPLFSHPHYRRCIPRGNRRSRFPRNG